MATPESGLPSAVTRPVSRAPRSSCTSMPVTVAPSSTLTSLRDPPTYPAAVTPIVTRPGGTSSMAYAPSSA